MLVFFRIGPEWLTKKEIGGFLFGTLVVTVAVTVPIGSAVLALLTGYGLLEFIGVLLRPLMKTIWRVPGRSAVDASASFVASFFIGLLITNKQYEDGMYSKREAAIIATGFSTVTVAFMLVIGETLKLMEYWNIYFWTTFFVTFAATAVTAWIRPLSKIPESYINNKKNYNEEDETFSIINAWNRATNTARTSEPVLKLIWKDFLDGLRMTVDLNPLIMSVGAIALVLATYTPIFDWLGYLYYPLTALLHIPEPVLAAKALTIQVTEMFLASLLVVDAPMITKFIIAVDSVSAIVFFSSFVPALFSTKINLTFTQLIIIWFERTVLSVIFTTPIAFLFFS